MTTPMHANAAKDRLAEVAARLAEQEGLRVRSSESTADLLKRIATAKGARVSHAQSYSDSVAALLEIYGLGEI